MWKVYFNKKTGSLSRPGSCWAPTFSGDQEEAKIPSIEQQDSRMEHLDVEEEEGRSGPCVRDGVYTASLLYMETHGNESSGAKMNSVETAKLERGKVIGDEAGALWKSVDAKDWYRAMKQRIFRHAFVSPFEAMEMLTMVNGEREPTFRIRPRTTGGKKTYATLNIMMGAALEQIEYQVRKNEKDEADRLLGHYASRLKTPTVAYLRGDGFKGGNFRGMD